MDTYEENLDSLGHIFDYEKNKFYLEDDWDNQSIKKTLPSKIPVRFQYLHENPDTEYQF